MAITFRQAQVDAAVNYLMTGGPKGGELTDQQYFDMVYMARRPQVGGSILSDFAWQLQLAINQGHSGISSSHNLCRDSFGNINDAFQAMNGVAASGKPVPPIPPSFTNNELLHFSVSISG